jgi:hypothetical protein
MTERKRLAQRDELDADKRCPVCGYELEPRFYYGEDGEKHNSQTFAYICPNCRVAFDENLKECGSYACSRQLKYVLGNGSTGMSPRIWKGEHYKFYTDNTIEFERWGYIYGKDAAESMNIASVRIFKLPKREMAVLEGYLKAIIEAIENGADYGYTLDGPMFSIDEYENTLMTNSYNSQNYAIPAVKELFSTLENITHSETGRYGIGDRKMHEYLLRSKQLRTNKTK